jgi:pilus biogenesis lipoprotein CpaD
MKLQRDLAAAALALVLGLGLTGCVTAYSDVEAPNQLTLDDASTRIEVRFAPGSSRLLAGDAARLHALAAGGKIAPSDRVTVSVADGRALATARFDAIAAELLRYRIVATELPLGGVPANRAIVQTARYLVTTPPCPNWSKSPSLDYTNVHPSNFGCTMAINFASMVASPADLVEGRPLGLADAIPAAAAVQRYQADKVVLPASSGLGPITASATAATGSGATGAGTAGSAP